MDSADWLAFREMDFPDFQRTNPEPDSSAFMQGDGAGAGIKCQDYDAYWAENGPFLASFGAYDSNGHRTALEGGNHVWEASFADWDNSLPDSAFATLSVNGTLDYGNRMSVIDSASTNVDSGVSTIGNNNQSGLQSQHDTISYNDNTSSPFVLPNDPTSGLSNYLQDNVMLTPSIPDSGVSRYAQFQRAPPASLAEYTCVHPGCPKKYTRRPDMLRHAKVHDPNAAKLDCPFPNCPRKGQQGFSRSDKLLAHERAHRRALQKARDRASR